MGGGGGVGACCIDDWATVDAISMKVLQQPVEMLFYGVGEGTAPSQNYVAGQRRGAYLALVTTAPESGGLMSASASTPRFAEAVFSKEHHVCAFFHNKDEAFRMLAPFILEGLAAGEKAIHVINVHLREAYKHRMSEIGVDVEEVVRSGQLEVMAWPRAERQGSVDQDAAVQMMDNLLNAAGENYPRTRVIGDMDWALEDRICDGDLIALEARLNDVYARHNVWVICAYDLSRFHGSVVLDVMRTHPAAIIGGILQHNPFYIPPAQMLRELSERSQLLA